MKKSVSLGIAILSLVLLAALLVLPVSGAVVSATAVATTSAAAGATSATPFISATVSSTTPTVGDSVTISGVATGGNFTSGVQMWVFAGNYVNVTNVPVNADGTYSKTYHSAGLPPATYYVFVQSPGPDGVFDIDLYDAGVFSGQVFNTKTNAMIFNFTGVGSVQDAAASKALSDALNMPGQDDIYTKLTFQLTAPVATPGAATTVAASPVTTAAPAAATTAKSPLPFEVIAGALVISGCCAVFGMRKTH
ncbi:MAG: hypothetical protein Q7T80_07830 [Methanoregula sp.]|nr:hypothetical protein [Methanoregula sp.]